VVANLVEMRDERGGWKAADTTVWREHLHAATVTGRVAGVGDHQKSRSVITRSRVV
jgi:hypothetical protein